MNKTIYKAVTLRRNQIIANVFHSIAKLLSLWPFILVLGMLVLPVTPHMLVTYTYAERSQPRYKLDCNYLGINGWVTVSSRNGDCDFIRLLNPNRL